MILLDLAVLNSYHLYTIQTQRINHDVMTQRQFRIGLARCLLKQNLQVNLTGHLVNIGRSSSKAIKHG